MSSRNCGNHGWGHEHQHKTVLSVPGAYGWRPAVLLVLCSVPFPSLCCLLEGTLGMLKGSGTNTRWTRVILKHHERWVMGGRGSRVTVKITTKHEPRRDLVLGWCFVSQELCCEKLLGALWGVFIPLCWRAVLTEDFQGGAAGTGILRLGAVPGQWVVDLLHPPVFRKSRSHILSPASPVSHASDVAFFTLERGAAFT